MTEKKRKKWYLRWWAFVLYFLVIIIVIAAVSNGGTEKKSSEVQYITEPGSSERTIEQKFIDILNEETNMGEQRVRQIQIYTYDYTNDYKNIDIEYMADENLSTNLTRMGMWKDALEVLKGLPMVLDSQVMKITLNPCLKLTDQYGNETVDKVMAIRITREAWEKINWDNFIMDNIPNIAESYWEHPALNK